MEEEKKRTKEEVNQEYQKLALFLGDLETKIFLLGQAKLKVLTDIKKLDEEIKTLEAKVS